MKVCVPIKADECERFNPLTVPTLITVRKEILEYNKQQHEGEEETKKVPDYKKTSLKPYFEYFDKFVKSMLNETIQEKRGKLSLVHEDNEKYRLISSFCDRCC